MSDYKQKMDISKALSFVNSMYTVRRKDTRATSADAIETVLYDYYRQCEKLEKIEQIVKRAESLHPEIAIGDREAISRISEVLKA